MTDNLVLKDETKTEADPFTVPELELEKGMLLLEMGTIESGLSHFESILKNYPEDLLAQFGQALALFANGQQNDLISIIDKLIEFAPEEHMMYRVKGYFLIKAQRYAEARKVFQIGYELSIEIESKKVYEFYFAFIDGDHLGALVKYNEISTIDAEFPDVQETAIICMLCLNDFVSFKKTVDDLLIQDPYSKGLIYYRGIAKFSIGDYQGAKDDVLSSLETLKNRLPSELLAGLYFILGYCDTQLKNYTQAIKWFSFAIALNPNKPEPFFERGIARMMYDDPENAIPDFIKAMDLNYEVKACLLNIGRSYVNIYKLGEAREYFENIVVLFPGEPDGHYGLGLCHNMKMEIVEARRELNICIQLDKNFAHAWAYLALLDSIDGLTNDALNKAKMAEELGDNTGAVELVRGILANSEERYADSIKWCDQALIKYSKWGLAYQYRGVAKLKLSDQSAIDDFKTARILHGDIASGGVDGAMAAIQVKRFEDAEIILTAALDLNCEHPKKSKRKSLRWEMMDPILFDMRAGVRIQLKKYRAALKDIDIVLKHDPQSTDLLFKKSAILCTLGKFAEALKEIHLLLKINPKAAGAHLLLGEINFLDKRKKVTVE